MVRLFCAVSDVFVVRTLHLECSHGCGELRLFFIGILCVCSLRILPLTFPGSLIFEQCCCEIRERAGDVILFKPHQREGWSIGNGIWLLENDWHMGMTDKTILAGEILEAPFGQEI